MARFAIALVAFLLVAGCAGQTSDAPPIKPPIGSSDKGGSEAAPPAPGTPIIPPNATRGPLLFETCSGLYAAGELSPEAVAGKIPPQFTAIGMTSRTVGTATIGMTCEKVATPNQIIKGGSFLWTGIWVRAVNQTWRDDAPDRHFYLLDMIVNNQSLVPEFANFSVAAAPGRVEVTTTAAQGGRFVVAASAGSSTISINGALAREGGLSELAVFWLWSGEKTFQRTRLLIDVFKPGLTTSAGSVASEGSSRTHEAFGDLHPTHQVPSAKSKFTFESKSQLFGGGE